jgi:hypothetical protein
MPGRDQAIIVILAYCKRLKQLMHPFDAPITPQFTILLPVKLA